MQTHKQANPQTCKHANKQRALQGPQKEQRGGCVVRRTTQPLTLSKPKPHIKKGQQKISARAPDKSSISLESVRTLLYFLIRHCCGSRCLTQLIDLIFTKGRMHEAGDRRIKGIEPYEPEVIRFTSAPLGILPLENHHIAGLCRRSTPTSRVEASKRFQQTFIQ